MRTKEEVFKIAYGRARILGVVEGPGNINRMMTRYTVSRKAGHPVESALISAVITTTGPEWYHGPSLGKASEDGHRCVVAPSAFGLRFVEYSDTIIGGRAAHSGWYTRTDSSSDEVYRGCVFRLPGKDKHTRLLAGYRDVEGDCYIVDFSEVYTAIPEQSPTEVYDNFLYDAARAGDSMAQKDAEECRDHDYKWSRAHQWQELCDSLIGVECGCESAATERDRMQSEIKEIEGEFPDVADFAREYV